MSSFLEGPWKVTHGEMGQYVIESPAGSVCHVHTSMFRMEFEERQAANLIAAAPQLLKMLERVLNEYATSKEHSLYQEATAAIAKAKGEA